MTNNYSEFKNFKYLLDCYYHEDVWEEHSSHEEIWESYIKNEHRKVSEKLLEELKVLSKRDISFVAKFIEIVNPHGLYLKSENETKEWFKSILKYFQSNF